MAQQAEVTIARSSLSDQLAIPEAPIGLVIFAHGSGSSRFSVRNRYATDHLGRFSFTTLLFDLLTEVEANDRRNVFDIPLLGARVVEAIDWACADARTFAIPMGLFGASTGAAAAIVAGVARPDEVFAIVSRGGRPELTDQTLGVVRAPTLLIVGGNDREVLALNKSALTCLKCKTSMAIISGRDICLSKWVRWRRRWRRRESGTINTFIAERRGSHRLACAIRAGAGRPSDGSAQFGERVKRGIPSCPLN